MKVITLRSPHYESQLVVPSLGVLVTSDQTKDDPFDLWGRALTLWKQIRAPYWNEWVTIYFVTDTGESVRLEGICGELKTLAEESGRQFVRIEIRSNDDFPVEIPPVPERIAVLDETEHPSRFERQSVVLGFAMGLLDFTFLPRSAMQARIPGVGFGIYLPRNYPLGTAEVGEEAMREFEEHFHTFLGSHLSLELAMVTQRSDRTIMSNWETFRDILRSTTHTEEFLGLEIRLIPGTPVDEEYWERCMSLRYSETYPTRFDRPSLV